MIDHTDHSFRHPYRNKKDCLLDWCRGRKIFSKKEVMDYGLRNYFLRADRQIRDFVKDGLVRRIDPNEAILRGLKGKMAWYEV